MQKDMYGYVQKSIRLHRKTRKTQNNINYCLLNLFEKKAMLRAEIYKIAGAKYKKRSIREALCCLVGAKFVLFNTDNQKFSINRDRCYK